RPPTSLSGHRTGIQGRQSRLQRELPGGTTGLSAVVEKVRGAVAERRGRVVPDGPGVLVGLVGRGIGLSRSPAMHEREGARIGLGYRYVLLDFDRLDIADAQLPEVVAAAEAEGFAGLNVTHPFKQAIIQHLGSL